MIMMTMTTVVTMSIITNIGGGGFFNSKYMK